jgi:glyoxylase-like metal-dependent hydrolase (beta-lactamase superfamily II)
MSGADSEAAANGTVGRENSGGEPLAEARYGPVRVLFGARGGRYPDGNSLLVAGERETLIIDPALGVIPRLPKLPRVQRVLNSHCHEDHIAGNHLFPDVPWQLHEADLPGIASLDAMMAIYGMDDATDAFFRKALEEQFHFTPRPDALPFRGGDRFDLGGVALEVVHTPGHTRGHCCFRIEWLESGRRRQLLYLGDIELSSFGPYYGDAWSDLADFERTLRHVRSIEADWYATFHHIGVVEGRAAFLTRLERFAAVIDQREARLLEYLREPHTMDELVAHRFVYRPGDPVPFADAVERRSMAQHIARLLEAGRLRESPQGRYQVAGRPGPPSGG